MTFYTDEIKPLLDVHPEVVAARAKVDRLKDELLKAQEARINTEQRVISECLLPRG